MEHTRAKIIIVDDVLANLTMGRNILKPFHEVYPALSVEKLFEILEELSENLGEDVEYDPIAFRGEWTEYKPNELIADYGYLVDETGGDINVEAVVAALEDETIIWETTDGTYLVEVF